MNKRSVPDDPIDFHDLPLWRRILVIIAVEYRESSLPNKIVLGAIVLVIALLPLAPFAKPFWAEWKQKQAFSTALEAWKKGDTEKARSAFGEATKGSTSVERWVAYARFAAESGEGDAARIWSRAVALNPEDIELQSDYARALLESGRPADAVAAIAAMPEPAKKDPRVLVVRAEAFLLLGRVEQAQSAFRQAASTAIPTDDPTTLTLAIIGSKIGDSGQRDAARAKLEEFAESDDSHLRNPALRALVDSAAGEDRTAAAGKLARAGDATFDDRLAAFRALQAADPAAARAVLPDVELAAEQDPEGSVALIRSLLENGNADLATEWIAARQNDAFEVTARLSVETSLHSGDWGALEVHLVDSGLAEPELSRALLSAGSFRATRPDFALDRWKSALRQIRESGDLLDLTARIARQMTWDDAWIAARRRALELDPTNSTAFDELTEFHRNRRDLPGMFAIINQRLAAGSPDPELRYMALRCRLVLAVGNTQTNLAEAQEFVRENPGDPECATTLALALHRADRLEEAAEVFGSMPPSAFEDPERAIIYGMVLAALGRGSEAMQFLEAPPKSDAALFPEILSFRQRAIEAATMPENPPQATAVETPADVPPYTGDPSL